MNYYYPYKKQLTDSQSQRIIEGKEYESTIVGQTRRGEGIAEINGFTVLIPNAKMGDHVKFTITRVSKRFANAEISR